ncbi:hypothetical protein SOVF_125520 [Spinacia oleracea]|nr:hypothetical protein SOVF_125520 [Spinacia oleracea]
MMVTEMVARRWRRRVHNGRVLEERRENRERLRVSRMKEKQGFQGRTERRK